MIELRNKFTYQNTMQHFQGSPQLFTSGKYISYGMNNLGELQCWYNEVDKSITEKSFTIDLKNLNNDNREGIMGKTGNIV